MLARMNVVFLSVIVENTGYESWQTESKLKILTKVLQFMLVAIFFFSHKMRMNKLMQCFYSLCTDPCPPFLRRGGRLYTGYDFIGDKDPNDRNAIELFTTSVKSKKGNQKNIYWYNKDVCRASKPLHFY